MVFGIIRVNAGHDIVRKWCSKMTVDTKKQNDVAGVSSFEDLYSSYRLKLIHFFTAKGLEVDVAEDLSQEVFFRFLRCNKPLQNEDHARNLLYRIAQNLLIDHFRKHNGSVRVRVLAADDPLEEQLPFLVAGETDPEENLLSDEVSHDIRTAVSRLPVRYAQAIRLKEYEGLSYQDIAAHMGVSQKAVESLLHRARAQLKQDLVETGRKRGGWWSGILVAVRGMGDRIRVKPLRVLGRIGSKWQGISLGLGSAGVGKCVLNVLVALLLLGSVVGTGVAATLASRGDMPASVNPMEGAAQANPDEDAGGQVVEGGITGIGPSLYDGMVGDDGQSLAVVGTGSGILDDTLAGDGGLLARTGDTARYAIVSAGAGLDIVLADLGYLLSSLTDPLTSLLFYMGVPTRLVEALASLADMKAARDISSGLVESVVEATYVVDETAAVLSLLPPAGRGGTAPAPASPGDEGEGVAMPQDESAVAHDTGNTASPAPTADQPDVDPAPLPAVDGQVTGGVVEGVGDLLEDVTGIVGNLLPF
ncbi:MAG: sigma-70 family RNA polymerase sigma factor [Actinobacteria bacterium]|jgi:RNA polymerase sigma-70 factor (ECF subfamily)|nr:MAG: sigma-70 family RNA polymerase sigma factor [Actinomycetota bacterium]